MRKRHASQYVNFGWLLFIIYELSVYRGEGKPMKLFLSLVGYKYTVSYDLIIDGN